VSDLRGIGDPTMPAFQSAGVEVSIVVEKYDCIDNPTGPGL
jgi:hypothetical protein